MKFANELNETNVSNNERSLKIKQEPVVKVKQELNEGLHNYLNEDIDPGIDEEHEIKEKSHVLELPILNSQEIVNNCDIMEIINLDDAFIDIPDDEVVDEGTTTESKVDFAEPVFIYDTWEEHNYGMILEKADTPNYKTEISNYKTEKLEDIKPKQVQIETPKPNLDIVVIDDSILNPVLPQLSVFGCTQCQNTFLTQYDLDCHRKLKHFTDKHHTCFICNLDFMTTYDYLVHKNKFHRPRKKYASTSKKNNWICPMCGKLFISKFALNNHRKYICDYQNDHRYECKYCAHKVTKWVYLKRHEKNCANNTKPKKDRVIAIRKSKQTKIQPNENGQFVCVICGRTYTRRYNLFKHQSQHRPREEWNFKCGDCGALFDHIHDLRRHLKSNICSKTSQKPEEINFVCTTCGRQLKTLQSLKFHITTHSNKRSYVCEACGKAFLNFNNLYQHRITHTDIRRHKCDMCEKVFKRHGGLNQHKKAFHLKLKPHECPVCKHKFALKSDMRRCKHSSLKTIIHSGVSTP